jgi:methionine-rich copper-binding protein CopC
MKLPHRRIQLLLAQLLSSGLCFIMAGVASAEPAHAKVLDALPKISSTITQAPTTVTVFTAENINPDPKKSNLFVYGPSGDLISQGNAKVSLSNPREMSITIKPDASNSTGVYVVQWITVSAEDGDPDQGAFVFTVKSAVAPTPTPATSGTTPPPSTTSGSGTSGIPLWVPIVVGIAALLVGLGGGFGLARSTARPSIGTMRKTIAQQEPEETPTKRS